jgi:hypothetical protein
VAIIPFTRTNPWARVLTNLWQGRRDSNPHTRFWRPES